MTTKVEQLFLEAEVDIRNNNFHEAFAKYESILYEEPRFAPAHNSIGWLYKTQLDDYANAEVHFKAAIQNDPSYPHPYFHLASIYFELEELDKLAEHLDKCKNIKAIEKSWIHHKRGSLAELMYSFSNAINHYKMAILESFNNERMTEYRADIERCEQKQALYATSKIVRGIRIFEDTKAK
ncbi:MAG: tetratricopeptide repeat protein [Chitinophagaceae bacterium]